MLPNSIKNYCIDFLIKFDFIDFLSKYNQKCHEKRMSDPKKCSVTFFRFLQILIRLDHKLREHITKLCANFDLPAPMLRDSVGLTSNSSEITIESTQISLYRYIKWSACTPFILPCSKQNFYRFVYNFDFSFQKSPFYGANIFSFIAVFVDKKLGQAILCLISSSLEVKVFS